MLRRIAFVVLAVTTGCVPLAAPPVEGQVGVGARAIQSRADVALQVRASVRPLEFHRPLFYRRADFGLGYALDTGRVSTTHAGYVELASVPYVGGREPPVDGKWPPVRAGTTVQRLMVRGQGRVAYDDAMHGVGGGGALQVSFEWLIYALSGGRWTSGPSGAGVLASYGEAGIGFHVEGAVMHFGPGNVWTAGLGVTVKLPALLGVLCCFLPR